MYWTLIHKALYFIHDRFLFNIYGQASHLPFPMFLITSKLRHQLYIDD